MHAMNAPLIIVGAGHAGGRAALTLRDQGYAGRLILIGAEPHVPYERPPLSKGVLRGSVDLAGCSLCADTRLTELGIEHLTDNPVKSLDPQGHRLQLADGDELPYSRLLLATGGRARCLAQIPRHLSNVFYLRTHDEALALRGALIHGSRLVIIGAGFIGLEVAATARALGCQVTLLEAGPRLAGRVLPEEVSRALLDLHRQHGVDVQLNVVLEGVQGSERAESVLLVDGRSVPCDAVVVGVGMQPNIELAVAAGLAVGQGIRVDDRLRTSAPDIFAAGDVCEYRLHPEGVYQRQETWRNAEAQGRHCALNMLGYDLPFQDVPGFWSDQYDWSVQTVGVTTQPLPSASRALACGGRLLFYLDAQQRLQGACGLALGNSVAKDIKLCERLIVARTPLSVTMLNDPECSLKQLLRL
ncbi:Pyridine nucleotide-disulfide oxidoreductase domain-containing protein [Pseudomonas syringae pv. actinidiae]|uniref:Pyridine nucleotide-disulfide oxidoreductase domain-containing protein n=2 Tax=Pseudomonas syringae TaxID=317 RepID=A0A7Z6XZ26_PSESF|nr:Pyridine nucleotide-disulfide oxidoreductase domain-containing protein [Pseudomonas syringae pv. actinidiae]